MVQEGAERPAEWYDASLDWAPHLFNHYTQSGYYFLWSIIGDRLLRGNASSVLEIGCGTGQLARLLFDRGWTSYVGFDFSSRRVAAARTACPSLTFLVDDARSTPLLDSPEYDTAVCTEVLEHIEFDLDVLKRLRTGTRFLGTVPNFPWTSHVRHFTNADEVMSRYGELFEGLKVDTLFANQNGKTFFLMDGIKY